MDLAAAVAALVALVGNLGTGFAPGLSAASLDYVYFS